MALSKNPPL